METAAKREFYWTAEKSSSCERSNMERSGGPRQDVNAMSMARLPSFDGWNSSDGYRRFDGHNRLLFKRLRNR